MRSFAVYRRPKASKALVIDPEPQEEDSHAQRSSKVIANARFTRVEKLNTFLYIFKINSVNKTVFTVGDET